MLRVGTEYVKGLYHGGVGLVDSSLRIGVK